MAKMKKYAIKNSFVQVPNATATDVEENISLQALGLIVNLWSYNVEEWELHKTELYKRYAKNKKTSVSNAWDELVENKYIIEFKFRKGKSWDYVYIYRIEPFSEDEIKSILQECADEYGVSSTSDFQQLKMRSSKCTVQNTHISNKELKKDSIKEKLNKSNNNLSIYEKIEKMNVSDPIKKLLLKKIDGLIDSDIKIIQDLYDLKIVDDVIFVSTLDRVLDYKKDDLKSYLRQSLDKEAKKLIKEKSEGAAVKKPIREEKIPEYMNQEYVQEELSPEEQEKRDRLLAIQAKYKEKAI